MDRRRALTWIGGLGIAACASPTRKELSMTTQTTQRAPVLFLAHGAPILLDDEQWVGELAAWGKSLKQPDAILVVSAHWQTPLPTTGAEHPVPLVYDFYGFPEKYYQMQFEYREASSVAQDVTNALAKAGFASEKRLQRGLDHGVYVPLIAMFGHAGLPVLQLSLPRMEPRDLYRFGQALAPLRDQNVVVIGSGFITHNLATFGSRTTPSWARDFDAWVADVITRRDVDALVDYRTKAPGVSESLPTHEHFLPLVVAAGVAHESAKSTTKIEGFWSSMGAGSFSRRSIEFA